MATHHGTAATNNRRTFRGRAGPTDGRLPKYQARRRKQARATPSNNEKNKYADTDPHENALETEKNVVDTTETDDDVVLDKTQEDDDATEVNDEINHLTLRVRNVRQSIQSSSAASANVNHWQQNVLNAVLNCVVEWRSIVNHFPNLDSSICKSCALDIFGLVQMAMQSGPLKGAKPGYFKRCGSDAAKLALDFLIEIQEHMQLLYFSEKQREAITKWQSNAKKAAEHDKPPSKSVQKSQRKSMTR